MAEFNEFKYIVGQEVIVVSKDRNLSGKVMKVTSRHQAAVFEGGNRHPHELENWYKVTGEAIHSLSFFENQLEPAHAR